MWNTNELTLQLHMTEKCLNNCKHCYLDRKNRSMDMMKIDHVLSQFEILLNDYREISEQECNGALQLTGGDPISKINNTFYILDECKNKNIKTSILGNPDLLTEDILKQLIEKGLRSYQISMDGDKEYHNKFRGNPNSFDNSIKALEAGCDMILMPINPKGDLEKIVQKMKLDANFKNRVYDASKKVIRLKICLGLI